MIKRSRVVFFSYILPYFWLMLIALVAIGTVRYFKDWQNQSGQLLYRWIDLKEYAKARYLFEETTTFEKWQTKLDAVEDSLEKLRDGYPNWLLNKESEMNLKSLTNLWWSIKNLLGISEKLFKEIEKSPLGEILSSETFVDIINNAYFGNPHKKFTGNDKAYLSLYYYHQLYYNLNTALNYVSEKSFFEEKIRTVDININDLVQELILAVIAVFFFIAVAIVLFALKMSRNRQRELIKNEENLSSILDSIGDALIAADVNGIVQRMNPVAQKLTGYDMSDAIGGKLEEIFVIDGENLNNDFFSSVSEVLNSDLTNKTFENTVLLSRNGEKHNISISLSPVINIDGNITGIVVVFKDISIFVKQQEILVQNEKMLSVGGLAAGMAHEINNPLAGMIQSANALSNRLKKVDLSANIIAAEQAGTNMEAISRFMEARGVYRMLDAIVASGRRASEIVQNMLSFARKDASSASSRNMIDLVDKVIKLASTDYNLKKKYDFRSIKIIREYQENLPLVQCKETKVQQVILNLLRNGAEAMQDGNIRDPAFIIRLYYEESLNMAVLEIEDNGPGMTKEIVSRIFEPFFTTKEVGVGTGLGLSISYFIITEEHKGSLSVESAPGKGSKFIIKLPVKN